MRKALVLVGISLALFAGTAYAEDDSSKPRTEIKEQIELHRAESQEQRTEKGKQALLKHIERVEAHLNRLLEKIDRMQMLDDDSKDELKDLVNEKLEILGNIEDDVNDADTTDELMEARADLRAFMKDLREDWRAKLKEIRSQNFDELLEKTKDRLAELREQVSDAEEDGDDVKNADHYLDHCEADIERSEKHQDADNMKAAASNLKHCYHDFRMVLRILGGEPVEAPESEGSSSK